MFEQFYNLNGNPFQLTPDPRFYFESATHRKALSYLGYGLAQGEGFIVITGEIGAGKTTLVGHLMATIDKARLTAAHIVTSGLSASDMVDMAAESFGIDTRGVDKAATLKAIEGFLHSEARAGRRCLLVVDEAQNLTNGALEELRMLSNFQLGGRALLQIFLLGQPEFRNRIENDPKIEQLRQRVIATHHLGTMEADEMEPYIVHRLSKVGWQGRPDITPATIRRIHQETGGGPRKANLLLSRLLLAGAVEETDVLDLDLLEAVLADREKDREAIGGATTDEQTVADDAAPQESAPAADDRENDMTDSFDTEFDRLSQMTLPREKSTNDNSGSDTGLSDALSAEGYHERSQDIALAEANARIEALEARVEEQEQAIRRVLNMMIDWVGHDMEDQAGRAA